MDLVSIGRMAALNGVTEKKLRRLQERGLLEPAEVNAETGYRYYSLAQCVTVDMIEHLRGLGFSYEDIRAIEDDGTVGYLHDRLEEQLADLERQRREIEGRMEVARRLADNCELFAEQPPCGRIFLEHLPAQTIVRFADERAEHGGAAASSAEAKDALAAAGRAEAPESPDVSVDHWEYVTRLVKRSIAEHGWSPFLFQDIGITIPRDALETGEMRYGDLFMAVDEVPEGTDLRIETLPAGPYLCLYTRLSALSLAGGEGNPEFALAAQMAAYAREQGLEIAGDYFGEQILSVLASLTLSGEALLRSSIPVRYGTV